MSTRSLILVTALAAAAGLTSTGCEGRCGEGTIDRDGVCEAANSDPDPAACGEGTVLGPDGKCTLEALPTVCDPETTTPDEETIPGTILCVGTGGAQSCNNFPTCPGAEAGKVTICGRLVDAETNQNITAAVPNFAACGDGGAADGPCELDLKFYDAVPFANDQEGTEP
jgi:hypothetical protein